MSTNNSPVINGVFTFTLIEKQDRNGDTYLFGGIQLINSVLFVRPLRSLPGEPRRWEATLKPYRAPVKSDESDTGVWEDEDNRSGKEKKK